MKKILTIASSALVALALVACGGETTPTDNPSETGSDAPAPEAGGLVSVLMPTESLERWNKDGAALKEQIEASGYTVDVIFSNNKEEQQNADIENQITKGSKLIILSAINGSSVGPAVEKAKEAGIPVLAYDRLIMDTDAVDYYVTFGLENVGKAQATYIIETLGLDTGAKGPFNIEAFAGDPGDNNAKYFFKGAWDLLQPYFASDVLVSPSGAVSKDFTVDQWQDIGIDKWDTETARQKMEARLTQAYAGKDVHLDAVLAANDSTSVGFQAAVEASQLWAVGSPEWPIFVGQDADVPACYNINKGLQAFTVWKDTRTLAKTVAEVAVQIIQGNPPAFPDVMNNNTKDVPTIFEQVVGLTKDGDAAKNYVSLTELVDSGYVTQDQIESGTA
jgi:putative multiple sugar transport system substrate-binding protein